MGINEKLAELRRAKGLTQKELAEALHVSRQAISRWEVGTAVPSLDNLTYLSRLYGVPLDDLVSNENTASEMEEVALPHVPEDLVLPPVPASARVVRPRLLFQSAGQAVRAGQEWGKPTDAAGNRGSFGKVRHKPDVLPGVQGLYQLFG